MKRDPSNGTLQGGNRMAKSWRIEPEVGGVIPDEALSVHG